MKYFLSFLITLLLIGAIETILWRNAAHAPLPLYSSQMLHMAFHKPVREERLVAVVKFDSLVGQQAEMVQIGDSSGFDGVKPEILKPYLPEGWRYMNASLQIPDEFSGMQILGDHILRRDDARKALVVIVSMFYIGTDYNGFGDDIALYYESIWRHVFALPSLSYREPVTQLSYYWYEDGYKSDSIRLKNIYRYLNQSHGWHNTRGGTPFVPHSCMAKYNAALAHKHLEQFQALARQYHVKLIFALGPVRCTPDESTRRITKDLMQWAQSHPDVDFPLPFYDLLPEHYMKDEVHVTPDEGANYYSHRWGRTLQDIVK